MHRTVFFPMIRKSQWSPQSIYYCRFNFLPAPEDLVSYGWKMCLFNILQHLFPGTFWISPYFFRISEFRFHADDTIWCLSIFNSKTNSFFKISQNAPAHFNLVLLVPCSIPREDKSFWGVTSSIYFLKICQITHAELHDVATPCN